MIGEFLGLILNDVYHVFNRQALETRLSFTGNRRFYDIEEGSKYLVSLINGNRPFCAGRYGSVECQATYKYLHKKYGIPSGCSIMPVLCNNAGFFPNNEELLAKFGNFMLDAGREVDFLALLKSSFGEHYIANYYCKNAQFTDVKTMDPITGWTAALEGMKVLVIHPFSETIRSQFQHREKIFPGTNLLPRFELMTMKAVQTVAGQNDDRFDTWFDALDYMTEEASKLDFDIALIGCGAYGLPLAARIKQMGRKAIHVGGALQLLFGIRGQRWDTRDFMQTYFNKYWVRPSESERPKNAQNVEGACYW